MKINRKQLFKGIPVNFEATVNSIVPIDNTGLLLVSLDYEGIDLMVPLSKEAVSDILCSKGVVEVSPGEVIPEYRRRKSSSEARKGPAVGTEKTVNGARKKLVRYDFTTPRLKGKRRVVCPTTGKKGFPIWERM